jgi:chromosome segregation ATPase
VFTQQAQIRRTEARIRRLEEDLAETRRLRSRMHARLQQLRREQLRISARRPGRRW